jgi:asparagine synthase (glutamine-hydrolysing)
MCGIAGFITNSHPIAPSVVCRVFRQLAHRGPDDSGYLFSSAGDAELGRNLPCLDPITGVTLLHRRLAILDLGPGGWQPMSTPDKRYYIVFNGEIYNYLELREELEGLGHVFHSSSDTEVLLVSYGQWGKKALLRFVGMFAFAILDTKERTLLLARDFFGIKPLYYTLTAGLLVFASEIKALLELPWLRRGVNPARLYDYLRYGHTDHGTETLFADIQQLAPAHLMEIPIDSPEQGRQECYWKLDLSSSAEISFEEAAERVRELFFENIRLHLRSDVPVGTALSGGIDSSSIVAVIRALYPRDVELHTFSYIASDPKINEENWIDLVTQATGAIAHKVRPAAEEILADLDSLIGAQDEPFGSTSICAQYCVFRLARESGIKVMLDGQGADEILGGYRYYMAARLASLVRQNKWREALRFLKKSANWPDVTRLGMLLRAGDFLLPEAWQGVARRLVGKELVPSYLNAAWFRERNVKAACPHSLKGKHILKELLQETLTETSLPHLLRYEDRNSMAFSIESRVPFLSPKLAQFMLSLPEEYLVAADGTPKAVFRKAMRGIVPNPILDRRDKIGFATPERDWLTALGPWVERVLKSDAAEQIPALDLHEVRREWKEVLEGRALFDSRVWRSVNLIQWIQQMSVVSG